MKTHLTLFLSLLLSMPLFAQDTLVKKSGQEISCKVWDVAASEVSYTVYGHSDSANFSTPVSDLREIRFAQGNIMTFANVQPDSTHAEADDLNADSIAWLNMNMGMRDADLYYRGQNSGVGAIAATTVILSPVIGVIPAIIIASTPPSEKNMNIPYKSIRDNPDYRKGYNKEAHHIKKKVVWLGFGSATLTWVLLVALLM